MQLEQRAIESSRTVTGPAGGEKRFLAPYYIAGVLAARILLHTVVDTSTVKTALMCKLIDFHLLYQSCNTSEYNVLGILMPSVFLRSLDSRPTDVACLLCNRNQIAKFLVMSVMYIHTT